MTGIESSSTTSNIVKKAIGGFVAQKYLSVAAGIFSFHPKKDDDVEKKSLPGRRNKKDAPVTRLFNRKSSEQKVVQKVKAKSTTTLDPSQLTARSYFLKPAAIAAGSVVGLVYGLYPTSLLLAFRVSETISWIRLFQHFHSCRMDEFMGCAQVGLVQAAQVLSSVGSIAYFWGLAQGKLPWIKSVWRGLLYYGLFWMLCVAIMKISVDELALYKPTLAERNSLQGKVAVITGANRGIGLATAQWMALHGVHVVLTCRTMSKCQPVVEDINAMLAESCTSSQCGSAKAAVLDLSSLQSANDLVEIITNDYPNGIHYLFCNAGTTPQYPLTKEGFEDGFGAMHLAHMAVTLGLLPVLKQGAENTQQDSRVVMVASEMSINAAMGVFGPLDDMFDVNNLRGERMRGDGTLATSMPAYGRAKLCNVLLALELNRQMQARDWPVIAHAVHTGAVVTDSSRNSIKKTFEGIFPGLSWLVGNVYFPMLWRNVDGGRRTLLCAALSEQDFVTKGGQYLDALCHPFLPESTSERELSTGMTIPIPLGGDTMIQLSLDAVQALLMADSKCAEFLWNTSIELLMNSPARSAVYFEGGSGEDHAE